MIKNHNIRLHGKIQDILACPLCKTSKFQICQDNLHCSICYSSFNIQPNGVVDFRVIPRIGNPLFKKYWKEGQKAYENWARKLPTKREYYQKQINDSQMIYNEFYTLASVKGILLDIGGSDGRLRHFCLPTPECLYVSIDPYLTVREDLFSEGKLSAYPILETPCDFVCGIGEFLPFASNSIDFVRINSVLDHLWDPYLAMKEIIRVLKPEAQVLLGVYVRPEGKFINTIIDAFKETIKLLLGRRDHHLWHPMKTELETLIRDVGLVIENKIIVDDSYYYVLKKVNIWNNE